MRRVRERESALRFKRIGGKEDLIVVGIGDASFKSEEKAVGGVMLFLANKEMTRAAPIFWKAKQISRVCHSSKDAETLNILKMVDDSVYAARQVEMLLYGEDRKRIKVRLFTDSEATLESIASSKQIERKALRMTVVDLKERLIEGDVQSYAWLPTERMWADILTKEKRLPSDLEMVLRNNEMELGNTSVNEVRAHGNEVRMSNMRNRKEMQ